MTEKIAPHKVFYKIECRTHSKYSKDIVGISFFNATGKVLYFYRGGVLPTAKDLLSMSNIHGKRKDVAKEFAETRGISAKNLSRLVKGVVFQEVIEKHPEWDRMFYSKHSWGKSTETFLFIEHEPMLQQCRKDGTMNIAPFVAYSGKTPAELKRIFGNALWKSLCKNTLSRNKLIAKKAWRYDHFHLPEVNLLNKCRSSVISKIKPGLSQRHFDDMKKAFGIKSYKALFKHRDFTRACNIIGDTWQFKGEDYNYNWSYRRILEEHAQMQRVRLENARKAQEEHDEEYTKLRELDFKETQPWLEEFESGMVSCTPLTSMQAIEEEGLEMHHCVGRYAKSAAKDRYVVYSLKKGEDRYTLGITWDGNNYQFQQMYGVCNAHVEDNDFELAAKEIIAKLNVNRHKHTNRKEKKDESTGNVGTENS